MTSSVDAILSEALALALLSSLWQGGLVAAVLAIALALVGPRAAARHTLAGLALVLMLALPMATFVGTLSKSAGQPRLPLQVSSAAPAPALAGGGAASPVSTAIGDNTVVSEGDRAPTPSGVLAPATSLASSLDALVARNGRQLALAWLIGVILLLLRLLGGWIVVRRLSRAALTAPSPQLLERFARLSRTLGVSRRSALRISPRIAVPMVVGVIRPVVLIPFGALSGLSLAQLELLLAHELAHVRRHDLLFNALQRVVEMLLYFHPAVWWASAVMRREREHASDELAISVTGENRAAYARALTSLETQRRSYAFAIGAAGGSLLDRVERLLGRRASSPGPSVTAGMLALIASVALALPGLAQSGSSNGDEEYRSLWATVSSGVEFEKGYSGIAGVPEGEFILLEERSDGQLLWRARVGADSSTAEQTGRTATNEFEAQAGPGSTVRFEAGDALNSEAREDRAAALEWYSDSLAAAVLGPLREAPFTATLTSFTTRVVESSEDGFVSLIYGHPQSVGLFRRRPQDRAAARTGAHLDFRNDVELAAHALAHDIESEERVQAWLVDLLGHLDEVEFDIAASILRLVPRFESELLQAELLEALAFRLGDLPAGLEDAWETVVASVEAPPYRERLAQVFEPGFEASFLPGMEPFWVAAGTLNDGSENPGLFLAAGVAGYATRSDASIVVLGPTGDLHWSGHFPALRLAQYKHLAHEAPASGRYEFMVTHLGHVNQFAVEVDGDSILPVAENVRVVGAPDRPVVRWDTVPGAGLYRLHLLDESGQLVAVMTSGRPEVDVAATASVLGLDLRSGTYRVEQLEAFSRDQRCGACEVHASIFEDGPEFALRAGSGRGG